MTTRNFLPETVPFLIDWLRDQFDPSEPTPEEIEEIQHRMAVESYRNIQQGAPGYHPFLDARRTQEMIATEQRLRETNPEMFGADRRPSIETLLAADLITPGEAVGAGLDPVVQGGPPPIIPVPESEYVGPSDIPRLPTPDGEPIDPRALEGWAGPGQHAPLRTAGNIAKGVLGTWQNLTLGEAPIQFWSDPDLVRQFPGVGSDMVTAIGQPLLEPTQKQLEARFLMDLAEKKAYPETQASYEGVPPPVDFLGMQLPGDLRKIWGPTGIFEWEKERGLTRPYKDITEAAYPVPPFVRGAAEFIYNPAEMLIPYAGVLPRTAYGFAPKAFSVGRGFKFGGRGPTPMAPGVMGQTEFASSDVPLAWRSNVGQMGDDEFYKVEEEALNFLGDLRTGTKDLIDPFMDPRRGYGPEAKDVPFGAFRQGRPRSLVRPRIRESIPYDQMDFARQAGDEGFIGAEHGPWDGGENPSRPKQVRSQYDPDIIHVDPESREVISNQSILTRSGQFRVSDESSWFDKVAIVEAEGAEGMFMGPSFEFTIWDDRTGQPLLFIDARRADRETQTLYGHGPLPRELEGLVPPEVEFHYDAMVPDALTDWNSGLPPGVRPRYPEDSFGRLFEIYIRGVGLDGKPLDLLDPAWRNTFTRRDLMEMYEIIMRRLDATELLGKRGGPRPRSHRITRAQVERLLNRPVGRTPADRTDAHIRTAWAVDDTPDQVGGFPGMTQEEMDKVLSRTKQEYPVQPEQMLNREQLLRIGRYRRPLQSIESIRETEERWSALARSLATDLEFNNGDNFFEVGVDRIEIEMNIEIPRKEGIEEGLEDTQQWEDYVTPDSVDIPATIRMLRQWADETDEDMIARIEAQETRDVDNLITALERGTAAEREAIRGLTSPFDPRDPGGLGGRGQALGPRRRQFRQEPVGGPPSRIPRGTLITIIQEMDEDSSILYISQGLSEGQFRRIVASAKELDVDLLPTDTPKDALEKIFRGRNYPFPRPVEEVAGTGTPRQQLERLQAERSEYNSEAYGIRRIQEMRTQQGEGYIAGMSGPEQARLNEVEAHIADIESLQEKLRAELREQRAEAERLESLDDIFGVATDDYTTPQTERLVVTETPYVAGRAGWIPPERATDAEGMEALLKVDPPSGSQGRAEQGRAGKMPTKEQVDDIDDAFRSDPGTGSVGLRNALLVQAQDILDELVTYWRDPRPRGLNTQELEAQFRLEDLLTRTLGRVLEVQGGITRVSSHVEPGSMIFNLRRRNPMGRMSFGGHRVGDVMDYGLLDRIEDELAKRLGVKWDPNVSRRGTATGALRRTGWIPDPDAPQAIREEQGGFRPEDIDRELTADERRAINNAIDREERKALNRGENLTMAQRHNIRRGPVGEEELGELLRLQDEVDRFVEAGDIPTNWPRRDRYEDLMLRLNAWEQVDELDEIKRQRDAARAAEEARVEAETKATRSRIAAEREARGFEPRGFKPRKKRWKWLGGVMRRRTEEGIDESTRIRPGRNARYQEAQQRLLESQGQVTEVTPELTKLIEEADTLVARLDEIIEDNDQVLNDMYDEAFIEAHNDPDRIVGSVIEPDDEMIQLQKERETLAAFVLDVRHNILLVKDYPEKYKDFAELVLQKAQLIDDFWEGKISYDDLMLRWKGAESEEAFRAIEMATMSEYGGSGGRGPVMPNGRHLFDDDDDLVSFYTKAVLYHVRGETLPDTMLRMHEAKIGQMQRQAKLYARLGSDKILEAGVGKRLRGHVVPRAGTGDMRRLDDFYHALHNRRLVETGAITVENALKEAYDDLKDLVLWEQAARLRFDPNQATVDDYMYRGWKPPDESYKKGVYDDNGRLVFQPSFRHPRRDATYREMRDEGFEPLYWNPYDQWEHSRMQGVRYRQQMYLVEALKRTNHAERVFKNALKDKWRVPLVGPAFEGKPFADNSGHVQYTHRWMVPEETAVLLESMYGKHPRLKPIPIKFTEYGEVHLIDVQKFIDYATFIPKRAKLFGSFFQHQDFLHRHGIGAFHNMVATMDSAMTRAYVSGVPNADWKRFGKEMVQSLKGIALVAPRDGKLLISGYREDWRRGLMLKLDDTTPLIAGRNITLKSISEAGLAWRDVTIFDGTDLDKLVREIADEHGWRKYKGVGRMISSLEFASRRGLFEGIYPAAMISDIENYIGKAMVDAYPNMTDEQLSSMIAMAANKKYSTIPISQSVFKGGVIRAFLTRTMFSLGETEGLLRQFTSALGVRGGGLTGGARASSRFWQDHWLGAALYFYAVANVIHYISTMEMKALLSDAVELKFDPDNMGEWLPADRYSPIRGWTDWRYNKDFASPNLWKGKTAIQNTLDIVGQMDTVFRVLNPAQFLEARQSVPIRAIAEQIGSEDFFNQPIDQLGPGGIASRTAAFVRTMFAPIGPGESLINIAREEGWIDKIPMPGVEPEDRSKLFAQGEYRIGTGGMIAQALGANIRAENFTDVATDKSKELLGKEWKDVTGPKAMETYENDFIKQQPLVEALGYRENSTIARGKDEEKTRLDGLREIARDGTMNNVYTAWREEEKYYRGMQDSSLFWGGKEFDKEEALRSENPNVRAVAEYWGVLDHPLYEAAKTTEQKKAVAERLRKQFRHDFAQRQAILRSKNRKPIPIELVNRLGRIGAEMKRSQAAREKHLRETLKDMGWDTDRINAEVIKYRRWYYAGSMAGSHGSSDIFDPKSPISPARIGEGRTDYQRGLLPSDTRPLPFPPDWMSDTQPFPPIQFPPDWMSDTQPSPVESMPFSGPAR